MSDKKVKISNILGSQIPDFIQADNPLFKEFLSQYYKSEEREYGSTYLSDHISSLKNIKNVADISIVEEQTIPLPGTTTPSSPVILTSQIFAFDDVINVNQTTGFPESYGLLKIDNEIITYKGKTATSFTGCIRGFSGVSEISTIDNPEFLTFSDTNASVHSASSLVVNLSFVFVTEFYKKYRYNFLPGLEGRNLSYGLNIETVLSRARDFYNSKGTDGSLKILFQVLYGELVDIIKPFEQTLMASESEYDISDDIVVEVISGDPLNLVGVKIFQDSFTNPTASGAISNINTKFLGNKKYYQISFSKGTIIDKFKISTKTKVATTAITSDILTVDSTIGFGQTGNFYYTNNDNILTLVEYTSKSSNQFFGCTGISETLYESDPIIDTNFVYGYENNDLTKICTMRIVGSISGVSDDVSSTKYFDFDDLIGVKHLGEKYDPNDKKFNTWFYNNLSYIDVLGREAGSIAGTNFITETEHFLNIGDYVDVKFKESGVIEIENAIVSEIIDSKGVLLDGGISKDGILMDSVEYSKLAGGDYVIKKKFSYVHSNFGIPSLLSNIQNSFSDIDNNTYVACSGYPSFASNDTNNRSQNFSSSGISTNSNTININNHKFINGEKIYLNISPNSGITGSSGYYYLKVIDDNNLKIALNYANLHNNSFEPIKWNNIDTGNHSITPATLYDGKKLSNQNNFKRIYRNPKVKKTKSSITGAVGIALNGVEYHSPISNESIFYGMIDKIEVTNPGQNFNVINPPTLSITDSIGTGCDVIANYSGKVSEVVVNEPGFDFSEVPSVTITGGNGSGAVCEAKLRGFVYSRSYTDFDLNLTDDTFVGDHRFSDGEEVTYIATGVPVGINTGINVGFATDRLSSGTSYFIAKIDNNSFSLAVTKDNALSKENLLDLFSFGNKTHTFKSKKIRNIIDRISVKESGSVYGKHRVEITSEQWPPNDKKDLFKKFVGINTFNNYIYAKNHSFNDGDVVNYICTGTVISGLSTETSYKVTVIDSDKFKLSDAGTATTISNTNYNRKIYEKLNSVGVGTHTFKYPDIQIEVSGKVSVGNTSVIPDYYKASVEVEVIGGLKNIFIKDGGVGYGVTNIVNYERTPKISLLRGRDGFISPIIFNGKIVGATIGNAGSEYTTPPKLEVVGLGGTAGTVGSFAELKAVISDGKITGVNVISQGDGYDPINTAIRVTPSGSGEIISTQIHEWKINSVERYSKFLTDNEFTSAFIQVNSNLATYNNKICSFYPVKQFRDLVGDNLDGSFNELTTNHSKIVGWAYDGNPIYGPVGINTAGITTFMESSYEIDIISDVNLRPPLTSGYFIQDYVYKENKDLDEYNGKFLTNSDFPNGTYAYFSTIDSVTKNPSFPYITFMHRNATDAFNYDNRKRQTDEILNTGEYKRNVTHLGLNDRFRRYPLLQDSLDSQAVVKVDGIESSKITKVTVDQSGINYKVNDLINFNNNSISANVREVIGQPVVSIGTTEQNIDNIEFSVIDKEVIGFTTLPHGLSDGDIVEISGISSISYKNIEGIRTIGITTLVSNLSESIGASSATGITTFISLITPTKTRKFKVNDVIEIGSEHFLILNYDDINNRYRVRRGYNETSFVTHSSGTAVKKLETQFSYKISKKLENKNVEFPKIRYFEGLKSVGIGTSISNVAVAGVGTNPGIGTIFKSIPPKAIYLPNHEFNSGDEVRLVSLGSTINATKDPLLNNSFDLSSFDKLFCTKLNSEFIGLATEKVGIGTLGISSTSENVFFREVLTNTGSISQDDIKIELITNNISGSLRKINGTVTVATATTSGQQHGLSLNDNFKLHIKSNKIQTFNLKYNESIRKLVINPLSFIDSAIGIGTTLSTITINNHDFETGDLIVYNSLTPASPLVNDGVYHVIKDSPNTIRLAENSYDLSVFPYNYIGIGATGGQNHEISKINPKLTLFKNNTVELVTSDSSLSNYNIEFYEDKNFQSKYNSDLITKTNEKTVITVSDLLAPKFFYRVQGKNNNSIKTHFLPVDERVPNHSQIILSESKFNNQYKVSGINTNTFKFNLTGIAETNSYTSAGISSMFYSTSALNEKGGIYSVNILNRGLNLKQLPLITSIGTTDGTNSVLTVESDEIGKIESAKVIDQGLEFSPDRTLKPKADSNVLLKLKNVLTLDSIGITSGGLNYTSPPKVLVVGNPSIVAQTTLSGTSIDSVSILTNDSGLSDDVRVIPIVNSNGVVVTNASTDGNKTVTLGLRAPNPESGSDSGFYNSGGSFPFEVNDEIFVENIKTVEGVDTYNSSAYNYHYFRVTGIVTTGGQESVSYSLVGLGTTGGTYQQDNNFGRVIKKSDLVSFKPIFKETQFQDDEVVTVDGKNISGIVAKNGWNPISETLKVFSVNGDFTENDKIVGSVTNNKGTVTTQFKFDFDLNVDSLANISNSWKTDTGKLNLDVQRLHDNDYYQRFSYSIKGAVPFNTWKDAVNSLDHVAGFKNFCNLGIGSTAQQSLSADSELGLEVDVDQEASVHEKYNYDLVSEDTNDSELSKLVIFKSKIITDYNESRTNKVLLIDDISSQFTGIVTTTGGGVIGTTSFNVFADGNSLFHREFDPSIGVSTETYKINLPKHNFNTGEELVYKALNGSIGIANTSDVNAGVAATNLLPSTLFVIREDADNIKVAISATFASAGIAASFTNVVGLGSTNALSIPSEKATIRTLISIDNVIQSPIGITTVISVGLSTDIGISTTTVFLNDTSEISGKSLFKIEEEIFKVSGVGVGTTTLNVLRGQMGTVAAAHTVGAAVTIIKGDYRINEGRLYFTEAPYGPTGIVGITTHSTFSGRAYYRLNYNSNKIIDDISDRFDGSTDKFNLTTNGVQLTGINTNFGAILINNIFQKPFYGDVGDINKSDYQIVGTGQTIDFTGTPANKDLPRGGIINEFDVGIGSGYQVPKKAIFTAVVSAGGTIQSVGIASGGNGYLSNPLVSVSSTTGVGAAISAFVTAGIVTAVTIANPGSGYTSTGISTGINFVTVAPPSPYKNIPLSGGNGSGATIDVVVGTGGSIISFDMADRGIGYEIGDNLELTTLPFQVGIGTSAFNITVKNKFQDKFAGWCFGQLLELDDFSAQFNGFRKSFLITRTVTTKEYYSIVAQEGSGIILQNNLLIFLNDILQKPGNDYSFDGGTRITFREAPKSGSKFKMYFYTASTDDFVEVDVDETIKPGDKLTLQYFNDSVVNSSISPDGIRSESVTSLGKVARQDQRVVYELIASDTVETTTYSGVGISTDADFTRPTVWKKQLQDLIIDGVSISKERNYLEPQILPTTGIIKSISPNDGKIYVKDSWLFKQVDNLGQTQNDINIVGMGTIASVETIEKVSYNGDYGIIVGIGTSAVGINTTKPALFFEIKPHPNIYDEDGTPAGSELNKVSKSGITTGDYFVIQNTSIGDGVTGIRTTSSGPETVSVGNTFLDNVYYAEDYVSVGSSMIRVFANVDSISGIDTTTLISQSKYGTYSWGSINVTRSSDSKSFTFHNQNGIIGIETSAQVIRTLPMKTSY